ncbi:peptidoglycan/xylan/chitin deacetylase (PgdA/CDA1 family) [Kribbella aluminosa]|uniref:Peptidoglycan/xylan/chitin deacetylase (PgdA/CDA1 family) n=1 Tax=Kribbella aluminosa TaxID=416017 RepID=A0ABS4UGE9_9ACTN|nr:polysaccharide deacetylase family protein [Kribbella aluminosa]MBP2350720.1 peptidoglycan/xylan/chitin deacetylase (PgdA/CDA1 family) [Kribbella aluminosa]
MNVRLTHAGNRAVGLAMMMLVSAVIGTVVVAAARSPAKPVTPPAAAPAAVTPGPTPLPTKYVVLTFDDGPDAEYTPKVLGVLAKYDAKATFFEVGQNVRKHPELTKRIHDAGHSVQNHTWDHRDLRKLTAAKFQQEVTSTDQAIRVQIGSTPGCLRPPYGGVSATVRQRARQLGKDLVVWTVDSRDWTKPGTAAIVQRVLKNVHSGSVILMHDGGGNRAQTVAALPAILTALKAQGYGFRTLTC